MLFKKNDSIIKFIKIEENKYLKITLTSLIDVGFLDNPCD